MHDIRVLIVGLSCLSGFSGFPLIRYMEDRPGLPTPKYNRRKALKRSNARKR